MTTGTGRYGEFVDLVNELRDELGLQRLIMEFAAPNGEVVASISEVGTTNGITRADAYPSPPACRPEPAPAAITRALAEARDRLGSYGNASIDQWDQAFIAASEAVDRKKGIRVKPHVMKGMMDVETGGNGNYPPRQVPAVRRDRQRSRLRPHADQEALPLPSVPRMRFLHGRGADRAGNAHHR